MTDSGETQGSQEGRFYMAFVDLEKAFDKAPRKKLWDEIRRHRELAQYKSGSGNTVALVPGIVSALCIFLQSYSSSLLVMPHGHTSYPNSLGDAE